VGTVGRVLGTPRARHLDLLRPLAPLSAVNPGQGVIESSTASFASGGTTGLAQLLEGPLKNTGEQVSQLGRVIADLKTVQQTHLETTAANTLALRQNTIAKASGGGGSVAGTITNFASGFLGGGGLLSPILSGILSLFGGGGTKAAPASLVPFQLPASIQYEGGLTANGQVSAVDYGQGGAPRAVGNIAAIQTQGGGTASGQGTAVDYGQGGAPRVVQNAAPQVTIQVSAMDSRSFLDHSDEIARAVREAILHSSPLNDAIAEL